MVAGSVFETNRVLPQYAVTPLLASTKRTYKKDHLMFSSLLIVLTLIRLENIAELDANWLHCLGLPTTGRLLDFHGDSNRIGLSSNLHIFHVLPIRSLDCRCFLGGILNLFIIVCIS